MTFKRLVVVALVVLLAACGRSAEHYVSLGNGFFDHGELEDAALNYRKAIQQDANYGEAHYRLGLCSLKQEKGQEALQALQRAVELMPANTDARV